MFAECIAAAILHKYYLRASQTEEVHATDATARLCFDMASMAARCQHRLSSRAVVAVVFPEYVFACVCIHRLVQCVCVWLDTHSKDQTGSHQLDFFSQSHKPQG